MEVTTAGPFFPGVGHCPPGSEQSLLPFLMHLVDRADSALSFVGLNCCAGISCLLVLGATNCGKRLFRCQESHVCRIFPLHDILPAVHTVLFLVLRKQHCRRIFSHKRPPNPWDMLGAVGVAPSSASARPRKVWPEVFCAKAVSSGKLLREAYSMVSIFSPMFVKMIALGESSGHLSSSFARISKQNQESLKKIMA